MSAKPLVSVTVVTYNSGRFIRRCLESALEQTHRPLEVIVIDNASTDGTCDILERFEDRCVVIYNERNVGFAAAQNQAIALSRGEWVLTLNPDVLLLSDFVDSLMLTARMDPMPARSAASSCWPTPASTSRESQRLDSTGMFFTPMLRHKDRGCMETNNGHYRRYEYVFGATAAAACYRRQMIADVSVNGEFFDAEFFTYREDADVAWRAQLLGWKCIFDPARRRTTCAACAPACATSFRPRSTCTRSKNRFLMRIKNITPGLYARNFLPITFRDLGILAYCVLLERYSLRAFFYLARNYHSAVRKRRWIQARRRVDESYMASWFQLPPGQRAPAGRDGRGDAESGAGRGAGTLSGHMKIALLGTRGIPANYGGFETFAEELATRLVERGHQVTV